jgi:hypothetical protein
MVTLTAAQAVLQLVVLVLV